MRINKVESMYKIYNNTKLNKVNKENSKEQIDELKISERALDFQHALNKIKDVEDIRVDKVNDIKSRIVAGTYDVSGREIANKLVDTIKFDQKI